MRREGGEFTPSLPLKDENGKTQEKISENHMNVEILSQLETGYCPLSFRPSVSYWQKLKLSNPFPPNLELCTSMLKKLLEESGGIIRAKYETCQL